ncbi:40S ribosomal S7 isoform A [Chlorella sorokiniana]|uniref:40S ribosomal S7 isoform A n=1 Tax=Chlorella sorokiniana TaxID=3076 RepID=A0A2P6TCK0_CHLSO|nr:40S ribosomal S7 isoform A [Chlorella sorokiniana]|eukprot:PRW20375.1 40S ribosomal S7 isoform A [Chlorella sorokiniana]
MQGPRTRPAPAPASSPGHWRFLRTVATMFTARKKIVKEGGAEPSELEEQVAQALFDLEATTGLLPTLALFDLEATNAELKGDLRDLWIAGATEVDVSAARKAILIKVPYRLLKAYHKVQQRLVRELEKKFSGKDVVIVGVRRILPPAKHSRKAERPRTRTLTAVHEAYLDDLVYPTEIVGKRIRYRLDGSKVLKVLLDPKDRNSAEYKTETFAGVYKRLTGQDVAFEFPRAPSSECAAAAASLAPSDAERPAMPAKGLPSLPPPAAATSPMGPTSPLWLGPPVATPRTEKRVRFSSSTHSSLQTTENPSAAAAAAAPPPSAPAGSGLQAAVRSLDARLPLADILPLQHGEGYLVVRRRLPPAAPNGATPSAAPTVASTQPATAAAAAASSTAPRVWTAADEAHYQESLVQLRQLVALREQAWPRVEDWYNRRAQAAGAAPGAAAALPLLLRWAVAARIAALRHMQQQWQAAQACAPPPPEPVQLPALLCDQEASAVLMQLSRDGSNFTNGCQLLLLLGAVAAPAHGRRGGSGSSGGSFGMSIQQQGPAPAPAPWDAILAGGAPWMAPDRAQAAGVAVNVSRSQLFLPPGRTAFDWSFAGYQDGDAVLPSPTVAARYDVQADFGAKGDGQTDDTAALQAAVAAANAEPGIIQLPAGTYRLSRPLVVTGSGVVLRGEGEGQTKILIDRSLSDVYNATWTLDGDGNLKSFWANGGAFLQFIGEPESSRRDVLSSINEAVELGSTRLPVADASQFKEGQRVRIYVNEAPDAAERPKSAAWKQRRLQAAQRPLKPTQRLAAAQAAAAAAASLPPGPPAPVAAGIPLMGPAAADAPAPWAAAPGAWAPATAPAPAMVQAQDLSDGSSDGSDAAQQDINLNILMAPDNVLIDPVYADAVLGTSLLSGGEPWLSLEQALASDADAGVVDPSGQPTVTAWELGGDIIDNATPVQDEFQYSARVAAVGDGWIELDRELPFDIPVGVDATINAYNPSLENVGVERLTLEFDNPKPYGEHGTDRGYNGIAFTNAANVWVNQVTVANADTAISLRWVDHATLLDVTVLTTVPRAAADDASLLRQGHRALSISMSHAVLVQRFTIDALYWHDIALGRGALLNVLTGGKAVDLNLHHEFGSFGNLVSDTDAGAGSRLWQSEGSSGTGPGATFWNLRTSNAPPSGGDPSDSQPGDPAAPSPSPGSSDGFVEGCSRVEEDTALQGPSLAETSTATLRDCYTACRRRPECGAVTYVAYTYRCYLKKQAGTYTRQEQAGVQSIVVTNCPSPPPPPSGPVSCGVRQPGIEFEGGDVAPAKTVSSIDECTILCGGNNACSAFTYFKDTRKCQQKDLSGWRRVIRQGVISVLMCPGPFPVAGSDDASDAQLSRPKASPQPQRRLLAAQPQAGEGGASSSAQGAAGAASKPEPSSGSGGKVTKADLSTGDASEAQAASKLPLQNVGSDNGVRLPGGNDRAPANSVEGGSSGGSSGASSGGATSGASSGGSGGGRETVVAAIAAQPLPLPTCDFGTELNFVGAWQGDSCAESGWLVMNGDLPADLYAEQKYARTVDRPVPEGAARPRNADAAEACAGGELGGEPAECWTLLYDHCIPGYTSRNRLPRAVVYNEQRVIGGIYLAAFESGSFGSPAALPRQLSRVCVPNPAAADNEACTSLKSGDYRVHVPGFRPAGWGECDLAAAQVNFVAADVEGKTQQPTKVANSES